VDEGVRQWSPEADRSEDPWRREQSTETDLPSDDSHGAPQSDGASRWFGEHQLTFWGRCYDHNFLRFLPIFGEKNWRFSQKPML
jgi:hypothetical protein